MYVQTIIFETSNAVSCILDHQCFFVSVPNAGIDLPRDDVGAEELKDNFEQFPTHDTNKLPHLFKFNRSII